MAFQRIELTARVVQEATRIAAGRPAGVYVWADTKLPYLQIRVRGGSARWTIRALRTMRAIGDIRERHPEFLSVSDARKKAAEAYSGLRYGDNQTPPPADEAPVAWTLSRVCLAYQAMISRPRWVNNRLKPPSAGTANDIRLAFAQPSYQPLGPRLVTELSRPLLNAARDGVSAYRQRQKCVAYIKAALTWAADTYPDESGLAENSDRWWERLTTGEPDPEAMVSIENRRAQHRANKAALGVDALAEILLRHETYCSGRTSSEKISPGVRFGLWWVCFTANRRASTVKLLRENLLESDPLDPTMGRAMWPRAAMKAKTEFWLPLPQVVRDVALGSIADYTALVAKEHGEWPSKWVFASTRRHGRDPTNDDVSVYPSSLNRHIQRMRAASALDGLPYFSLHLARSVMANFLDQHVSPVAASLVLAHTLPQTADEASPTTRDYYLTTQRMNIKREAMIAWSDALVAAVQRAGGTLPAPREAGKTSHA